MALERVKGIEPLYAAWEAAVLPLNYTRRLGASVSLLLMIQVIVNGSAHRLDQPLDVAALIQRLALSGKRIAVERNGEIVPKSAHGSTLVADGDRLEIVVAVGGG
jgi:sulfur carrier protein